MEANKAIRKPPLAGLKVLELAGTAMAPFTGMVLADLGCDVVRVDLPDFGSKRSPWVDSLCRRKSSVVIDFKSPSSRQAFFELLQVADVLIDPYRPGAFARMVDITADELCRRCPKLVYARVTGFSRNDKTYARAVGHEGNFMSVSGGLPALHHMRGLNGTLSKPTTNYLADFGGGSLACVVGILAALVSRTASGRGQIIDASVQQGTSYLATFPRQRRNGQPEGEPSLAVDDAPYSDVYRTSDGKYMMLVCIEQIFYERMIRGLDLDPAAIPSRDDRSNWPVLRELLTQRFRSNTQKHWRSVFDGVAACVSPVLDANDIDYHPPLVELSETPSLPLVRETAVPSLKPGEGSADVLRRWLGPRSCSINIDGSALVLSRENTGGRSKL